MILLIRNACIVDPRSPLHLSQQDILIEDGRITRIGQLGSPAADQDISIPGLHVSPGWVDLFAHACDPGYEYRETLETCAAAAAAGGYTQVMVIPNTQPVLQHKSQVEYVRDKKLPAPVTMHPIGAISRNAEGKDLAEMYDMQASGAVAFSDGLKPVQSAGLLIKALQYVKAFDGVIIQVPDDQSIAPHGLMHEGVLSTRLGLAGKPAMAEEIMIARDIKLARYADSALHFTGVSTAKSLEYIRRAKEAGLKITASVTPYHLWFTDEDLADYDTNLKVNPPLRPAADRDALRAALVDGTIDAVASHHIPQDKDSKVCEFEYAKPGMLGLQTAAGVLGAIGLRPEQIVTRLSLAPRSIFRLTPAVIAEDQPADLTLFLPEESHIFTPAAIRSRSVNTPFTGIPLKGVVAGTILGNRLQLNKR